MSFTVAKLSPETSSPINPAFFKTYSARLSLEASLGTAMVSPSLISFKEVIFLE